MNISINDLVSRVRVNMEELTDNQLSPVNLSVGVDVETYIRAKLPDALLSVWSTQPLSSLSYVDCAPSLTPIIREDNSGFVFLPNDMWKMVSFRIAGWNHPVTKFIDMTSPEYELQYNRYTCGKSSTPVCAIISLEGRKCLEFYSLPDRDMDPRVETALYVPYPDVTAEQWDIPPTWIPVVCYTCAAMVYEILGQPDLAAAMLRQIVQ